MLLTMMWASTPAETPAYMAPRHEPAIFRKPLLIHVILLFILGHSRRNRITIQVLVVVVVVVLVGISNTTSSNTFDDVCGVCCVVTSTMLLVNSKYHY